LAGRIPPDIICPDKFNCACLGVNCAAHASWRPDIVNDAFCGIRLEVADHIGAIVLARAARRNALDRDAWANLAAIARAVSADPAIRVVTIEGEGEHFCAGADLHELAAHIEDADWMRASQAEVGAALDAFAAIPQPVVAKVRGSAFGGGMALALSADFTIATADARFAITPARLGLSYRLADCARVVDCVGARRARELLLAARELDAAAACAWGLVTRVVDAAGLDRETAAFVAGLRALSATSQRAIKDNLLRIRAGQTHDDAATHAAFAAAFDTADFRAAARAFLDKKTPRFDG
jgi:enoyl-CoA hydratase/carnithine racemase